MGARRYGISLLVFNSIAHELDVELNTKRDILYQRATMYYFVYHINTTALYWQEKPTLLMGENKVMDNFRIKIVMITKTTMANFQFAKFPFIDFVLTDRRNPWRPNRPVANLPAVDFRSQPREVPLPKPLNT